MLPVSPTLTRNSWLKFAGIESTVPAVPGAQTAGAPSQVFPGPAELALKDE